ncbi:MAG: toll/interleukin-1 receptor domain-containing protein [Planctomycetes bacterium]|jgi:hypothetical protein|nr:toll/interleukin-1 receptor domain-containing protein [Planctomycetota bacterium]
MDIDFGPVVVRAGRHAGRVGYLDNDLELPNGDLGGIVYFGDPLMVSAYDLIPMASLKTPTTPDLLGRRALLFTSLTLRGRQPLAGASRIKALHEMALIDGLLADRMFAAQFTKRGRGARLFLSHATSDKTFARSLAVDLHHMGHTVWLDEWEISVGQSIPLCIGQGIDEADFVLVVLSKAAVKSGWVAREWSAKYWDEVGKSASLVMPVLLQDCTIPALLRGRKYADFRHDYPSALEEIALALAGGRRALAGRIRRGPTGPYSRRAAKPARG